MRSTALVLLGLLGVSAVAAQETPTTVAGIREELREVIGEIRKARVAAFGSSRVREAHEKLETTMATEMSGIAPEKKQKIERRAELRLEALADDEGFGEKARKELQRLERELADIARQAVATEAVRKRQEAFEAILIASMNQVNPHVPDLIRRREALLAAYVELRDR